MDRFKGSKKQMYLLSNQYSFLFEKFVGEKVTWKCPNTEGHEIQLNNKELIKELQLPNDCFKNFWPIKQPVWDGLAYGIKSNTLFLIEAKAHLDEPMYGGKLDNNASQKQIDNDNMKSDAIINVMESFGITDKIEIWRHKYFQLSNRLVFLKKMKELTNTNCIYKYVKLIYICFINDPHWEEKKKNPTASQWKDKFVTIFGEMGLDMKNMEKQGVNIIAIDCNSRTLQDLIKDGK